ncbi:MAG: SNF2-related protein [Gammaproteobacteria bacterium]|nr:SNF2-related protein [Gammaproteobacteria bacterium]
MGQGKTVQTLALLLNRASGGAVLVVAPTSVVANWLDEARRFALTLNVRAYTRPAAARRGKLEGLGPFDTVTTTCGLLHNDVGALSAVEWSTVVLDEAQAIKNPATKRAGAARRLPARFRIVTTATPVQHNVADLYSLSAFLNPGMLGSMLHFRKHFAVPIERDRSPAARSPLRHLISPFVLRRLKSDVLGDLPRGPRSRSTSRCRPRKRSSTRHSACGPSTTSRRWPARRGTRTARRRSDSRCLLI